MPISRRTLLKNSAAATAALGLDWTRAQAQAETVRIGVIYDLTGPFAGGGSEANYIGTKAAIDMMTLCLVQEQAQLPESQCTRIFALAPGVIDTAMQAQIRNADESGFTAKNKFVELHKNQQLYNVHDVAIRYVHLALNIDSTQEPIQRVTL